MENDDIVKLVIVVRHDLHMRQGKAIAQSGHAVSNLFISKRIQNGSILLPNIYDKWLDSGQTKIAVRVDSLEEFNQIHENARETGLEVHEVVDSGRTEFKGVLTPTCLSIGPDYSSKIDSVTSHLKLM